MKRYLLPAFLALFAAALIGCQHTKTTKDGPITFIEGERGTPAYEDASLKITSPASGDVVDKGSTVNVKMKLDGYKLKEQTPGYKEKGLAYSSNGQHIHLILDDNPYNAIYDISEPVQLKDVEPGFHVLQAFPSRSWHESVKSDGAFAVSTFHVGEKGDVTLDTEKPFLVYSRPKGTYEGKDAEKIMVDFYVANADIAPDKYTVKLTINGTQSTTIDSWKPHWVKGLGPGKHKIKATLIGPDGTPVENGFNPITRVITVKK
jgi:hypothetical protein